MKKIKIQSDEINIHLDCAHCNNWEQLGIDDPRKRLNVIPIIEWKEVEVNQNEVSIHRCTQCNKKFEVEWDYSNPMA